MKRKKVRERGKVALSRYFQKFKNGDKVSIIRELSVPANFHKRIQGRTGVVEGTRGEAYIVKVKELNALKTHIIKPIHLKKLK